MKVFNLTFVYVNSGKNVNMHFELFNVKENFLNYCKCKTKNLSIEFKILLFT